MKLSVAVWRIVAPLVAGVFFWLALRPDVAHATSPEGLTHTLFGAGFDSSAAAVSHPAWLSLHIIVRKMYSVIAFTIVGFCADKALGPARRRMLRAVLLIAAYSLAIEIGQRLAVGLEPLAERLFDISCGAAGGACAIALEAALAGGRKPRRVALCASGSPCPAAAPSGRRRAE